MLKGHQVPVHVIERPAVRSLLDAALNSRLAVVVAQAGSGKSILLAQWAMSHPSVKFVWLDLVAAHDDPAQFARLFLEKLVEAVPGFTDLSSMVAVGDRGLGLPFVEELARELVESGELVIVLDDVHHLSNAALLGDLAALIAVMPATTHIVISSRNNLPFPFRKVASVDIVEIRQEDIAVSFADTSELLARVAGRSIAEDTQRALLERTEGWMAGLVLAGVTLRTHANPDVFVTEFAGSNKLVVEYLGEEVMRAQSVATRLALLRMSVLKEMSAGLVDHLFGEANTQLLFEELERSSLFLVSLDTRREWFRFHHLFGEMLRYRFRADMPGGEKPILIAAAQWHLDRGEIHPAVEYLLRAQDWEHALQVILSRGAEVFERLEMATVVRWIEQVPANLRAGRHDISFVVGALKGINGDAVEAEDILLSIVNDPEAASPIRACAEILVSTLGQVRPHPEVFVQMAVRGLASLRALGDTPTPDLMRLTTKPSLETVGLNAGGRALFLLGDMAGARIWFAGALASDGGAYSIWRIISLGSLALLEAWDGRTVQAEKMATEALLTATGAGTLSHPSIGEAYLALTLVALERGEPSHAGLSLHEGIGRATTNRRIQLMWVAYLLQLRLSQSHPSPEELILPHGAPPPIVLDKLLALHYEGKQMDASLKRLLSSEPPSTDADSSAHFARTVALPQSGRRPGPATTAAEAKDTESDDLAPLTVVRKLLLQVLESEDDGVTAASTTALATALAVAEPHQLVDIFVTAGPKIIRKLSAQRYDNSPFVKTILRRWETVHQPAGAAELAAPLTERELEILAYLPTHLNTTELAQTCFVSINTIKSHMAHIYMKLGTTTRDSTVKRARELKLLPAG